MDHCVEVEDCAPMNSGAVLDNCNTHAPAAGDAVLGILAVTTLQHTPALGQGRLSLDRVSQSEVVQFCSSVRSSITIYWGYISGN